MAKKLIIAVDGYSSCGKSTFARLLAKELGYTFIDTGAMYRAATLFFMRKGFVAPDFIDNNSIVSHIDNFTLSFISDNSGGQEICLNGENVEKEIRTMAVSNCVSPVSTIKEVREKMLQLQRAIGAAGGVVMDGRDIGTAVFPNADLKIFMTASTDVRAERRFKELQEKGMIVDREEIRRNLILRDMTDENREINPLRRADDAITLDNSMMTIEQELRWARTLIAKLI